VKKTGLAGLMTLDVGFLLFMMAIGIGFIWDSMRLNAMAATLPRYTSLLLIGLIIFVLYGKVRDAFRPAAPAPEASNEPSATPDPTEIVTGEHIVVQEVRSIQWFLAWLMIASYPFVIQIVGFTVGTFVFLSGVSMAMGSRPLKGLAFGVILTFVLVMLFVVILKVPMPDNFVSNAFPQLQGY
jgi:hypothetical protein